MLAVSNLSKSYNVEKVLNNVSFTIKMGERVGLVGANGSGKSTLLRILAGVENADVGSVKKTPSTLRVGYLPQGLTYQAGETLDTVLSSAGEDLFLLNERLEDLAKRLSADPDNVELQEAYDLSLAELTRESENQTRCQGLLAALGLGQFPLQTPVEHLSGGQKTRLSLARVLLSGPELLLLDEPTNHLDLEMLTWLENWLVQGSPSVLVVSHDRAFLDGVVTSILELDQTTHTMKAYPGNYSACLDQKQAEHERHWQAYTDQQDEIGRLQLADSHIRSLTRFKKGGKADSGDKFAKGFFADRSLNTMGRAKNIERRLDKLLNEDNIEKPRRTWEMRIEFGETPSSGRMVLSLEDLGVGYGDNVLLKGLNLTLRHGKRVALIGPNGSGKTTLLRTISGKIPALSGSVRLGANVKIGYMEQEQKELDGRLTVLESVRRVAALSETGLRSFLSLFLFKGDDVFVPVQACSYGERARLSLALLTAQGCNLLMLDEPLNHLDIPARTRFEEALSAYEGTILAVVHDRYFIDAFANEIWEVRAGTLACYEC